MVVGFLSLVGCSSSIEKVTNKNAPTMEQVFNEYSGGVDETKLIERKRVLLQRPALDNETRLPMNPYAQQLEHLYPRLPNPDLFMYVRPHAVGSSGAPIPAYITRFSMYERQPYALPGETLESLKIDNDFLIQEHQRELAEKNKIKNKNNKKTKKGNR
jgi:conjugative transfer region lipoprotein (TIGR03751 family)